MLLLFVVLLGVVLPIGVVLVYYVFVGLPARFQRRRLRSKKGQETLLDDDHHSHRQ